MELGALTITPEEAEAGVEEYAQLVAAQRSAEDEAILMAYRAAKRGLPVISLSRAFDLGGFHDNGLPKLAIMRADAKQCFVRVDGRGDGGVDLSFCDNDWNRHRGALVGKHTVNVHTSVSRSGQRWRGSTLVPPVPPRHRPKRGRIGNFHILWEVDEWTPVPPRDPALLRHIRGDLWSVVAVWDLTDIERMVLSQRSRS
jgi:hypothetical protein